RLEVEQDHAGTTRARGIERGASVRRGLDFERRARKEAAEEPAVVFVVVDDQDPQRGQLDGQAHRAIIARSRAAASGGLQLAERAYPVAQLRGLLEVETARGLAHLALELADAAREVGRRVERLLTGRLDLYRDVV